MAHRIDTPSAQKDKFGAGKNGFTRGNPQTGEQATALDDDYFDMLQEELVGIVESAGIALDKAKHDQILTALKKLFLSRANPFGDIKTDGATAIAKALENLGLGPIANAADIAAGSANKLIDAYGLNSYFPYRRFGTSGYIRIPNQPGGLIIQWGPIPPIPAGGSVVVNYGYSLPESFLAVVPVAGSTKAAANSVLAEGGGNSRVSFLVFNSLPGVTEGTGTGVYIALGF